MFETRRDPPEGNPHRHTRRLQFGEEKRGVLPFVEPSLDEVKIMRRL